MYKVERIKTNRHGKLVTMYDLFADQAAAELEAERYATAGWLVTTLYI